MNEANKEVPVTLPAARSTPVQLTDKQYAVLVDLFNELNEEFYRTSEEVRIAFYDRLYR